MTIKIFISHNHHDKPVVEPVALRLKEIFGQENVFYDSWSIRPGDGVIDKMNEGLEAPDFVFFFVSNNSLNSEMVKLEWQNALYAASKGKTHLIPVRTGESEMPAILRQSLYIDMFSFGLEAAISQIVSVAQGDASFTPQHQGFSNLTQKMELLPDGSLMVEISASHLFEPNPSFAFEVENSANEISGTVFPNGGETETGFGPPFDGQQHSLFLVRAPRNVLKPGMPLRLWLRKESAAPLVVHRVMHQVEETKWRLVPRKT